MPTIDVPSTGFNSLQRVLVLGSNGRIGRLLARIWGDGHKFGLLTHWQSRDSSDPGLSAFASKATELDILTNPVGLAKLAEGKDAVLVLAGVTPSGGAKKPDYDLNVNLAKASLTAAQTAGVPRVFLFSSASVYEHGDWVSEAATPAPVQAYAKSKLAMEQLAEGVDGATILRIGNIAGADQLLGPGHRNVSLDVFEDGRGPVRSYIGPTSLARILAELLCVPKPLPACLNIAAPAPVDMVDLLRAAGISFSARHAPPELPPVLTLNTDRLGNFVSLYDEEAHPQQIVADWLSVTGGSAW